MDKERHTSLSSRSSNVPLAVLPCGHQYHAKCIALWWTRRPCTCPYRCKRASHFYRDLRRDLRSYLGDEDAENAADSTYPVDQLVMSPLYGLYSIQLLLHASTIPRGSGARELS